MNTANLANKNVNMNTNMHEVYTNTIIYSANDSVSASDKGKEDNSDNDKNYMKNMNTDSTNKNSDDGGATIWENKIKYRYSEEHSEEWQV